MLSDMEVCALKLCDEVMITCHERRWDGMSQQLSFRLKALHVHALVPITALKLQTYASICQSPNNLLRVHRRCRELLERPKPHHSPTTTMTTTQTPPFHRLLSFYSNRSPTPDTQTIRLQDSLHGNLALGLDFPVALAIALGRHVFLKNTSFLSLNIHIPSVPTTKTLLEGLPIEEKKSYSCSELVSLAGRNGWSGQADAVGVWALAADVHTGRIEGADVVAFQKGTLLREIERRRKDRSQVLPLYRGGPISVAGHSWVVQRMFGVEVYQDGEKKD